MFAFLNMVIKMSIPMIYASAAMYKLCELPFSGPQCIILKICLEKNYALPLKVWLIFDKIAISKVISKIIQ